MHLCLMCVHLTFNSFDMKLIYYFYLSITAVYNHWVWLRNLRLLKLYLLLIFAKRYVSFRLKFTTWSLIIFLGNRYYYYSMFYVCCSVCFTFIIWTINVYICILMTDTGLSITTALDDNVFGFPRQLYILTENVIDFLEMKWIGARVISAYMA